MTHRWWLFWRRQVSVLSADELAERKDALERVQALEHRVQMLQQRRGDE